MYSGTNSDTGKRRYRTATVVGNRGDAERGLAELVASVRSERSVGSSSTVSELLEAWFVVASGSWAPTTIRQTRSVVDRYLHPQLGEIRVGEPRPGSCWRSGRARWRVRHQRRSALRYERRGDMPACSPSSSCWRGLQRPRLSGGGNGRRTAHARTSRCSRTASSRPGPRHPRRPRGCLCP